MNRCWVLVLVLANLLLASPSHAVVTTYNTTKDLDTGAIDFTPPVNSQILFVAQIAVNFSAAPEAAETVTVDVVNQIGPNFAVNLLKYVSTAGVPTALTLIANAAIPVAVGSTIRVRVTNASQSVGEANDDPTAYVTVTMDSTERTGQGLTLSVNGKIALQSTPQTDGIGAVGVVPPNTYVLKAGDSMQGALVFDNAQAVRWAEATAGGTNTVSFLAPATLTADRTCTFQDSNAPIPDSCVGDGSDAGGAGGTSNSFETMDAPAGTDPVADSATDTLTWTIAAPFTLTGDSTTDTLAIGMPAQTANTLYAGPLTGAAAVPTFRALGDEDLPDTLTASNYILKAGDMMTGTLTLDNAKALRWREATPGGTNHVAFLAPATLSADRTCTFQDSAAPLTDSCVGNGVDDGLTVETDPTLTNDGAVTIGSGSVDPTTLTFNSDAGTDGVVTWTGATDAFEFNGNVGIGGPPSAVAALHINKNVAGQTYLLNENQSAAAGAMAVIQNKSDVAYANFNAYAAATTATLFGQVTGGWTALVQVGGDGLMVGTFNAGDPLILGASNVRAMTLEATGITAAQPFGIAATGTATTRLGQRLGVDTTAAYGGAAFTTWSATAPDESSIFDVNRSRSNTPGTYTVVANNDTLGNFVFRGSDGTTFQNAASIAVKVDGVPGAGDMPGRLQFHTSPDGAANTPERMRIDSQGRIGMGTTTFNTDSKLEVGGHITVSGTAPAVSACGTSPTIAGSDMAGKVTVGTGTVTNCSLTFATQWGQAPICMVNNESATQLMRASTNTTTLILWSLSSFAGNVVTYLCLGRG